jgi:hypothetical protein
MCPDERTHGGYASIFQTMLHHQAKKLTVQPRIDASLPVSMQSRAEGKVFKPKSKEDYQNFMEKTYMTIQNMGPRTAGIQFKRLCIKKKIVYICVFID